MSQRHLSAPARSTWRGGVACELAAQLPTRRRQTAVEWGDETLTYAALETHAAVIAGGLKRAGLGPGSVIGLYLDRSDEVVPAILGILRIGAAWLPLDPAYPRDRSLWILEDAGAAALLTTRRLSNQLDAADLPAVIIDDPAVAPPAPLAEVSADMPAYLIYTSGSTGRPKGVTITHGNLCHYARAIGERLDIGPRDRYLHTASFAFSSSVRQVFAPLFAGARILIASREEIASPRTLLEGARQRRATVADLVPSYWAQVIAAATEDPSLLSNSSLRLALSASEPLPSRLVADWYTLAGKRTRFVNMYGQTETTGITSTALLTTESLGMDRIAPIGLPLDGTQVHVVDDNDRAVTDGSIGELCIGGAGVGAGYWRLPELTAVRFTQHPEFGEIYRTGDLGSRRSDGQLVFRGRRDGQLKIRGHRVEVEEVEAALDAHPDLADAAVYGIEQDGEVVLAAAVVPKPGKRLLLRGLRRYLQQIVPDYMIPTTSSVVGQLPRTPNGKIDRAALAAPTDEGGDWSAPLPALDAVPNEEFDSEPQDLAATELALARHDAVERACVTARPSQSGQTRLTAYVVFEPGRTATVSELRQFLKDIVPDTAIPQHVVEVETLPIGPGGTIDRSALPDPFEDPDAGTAPRTKTERLVAEVWIECLGITEVGIHDNFLDVGGHSLAAMQAVATIERRIGVRLRPTDMVYHTLEQIAAKCEERAKRIKRPR
ncbi:MAG: amino acid adenylation domain-containing protein [Gemmatimonadales bacterium]